MKNPSVIYERMPERDFVILFPEILFSISIGDLQSAAFFKKPLHKFDIIHCVILTTGKPSFTVYDADHDPWKTAAGF
jgi:hypothetical protein